MSDIAIRVENLGKKYKIGANQARYQTLRESIVNGFSNSIERFKGAPPKEDNIIWALKDINFEVKHGEVLGIIGRNGAGKSTLLKILSRITKPTTGRFELNGRVGSLLEVGTGFHPELTGRENIYLSGAILGMKRNEINRKFDEIVDFAEIEKFLDTPVKHYSSGMYMRLAFSVAAHLEPEILLVDEVLAVGDAEFQRKCLGKMGDVAGEGRTVLFVSHNMSAIRNLCPKCLFLSEGNVILFSNTEIAIENYISKSSNFLNVTSLKNRTDRIGNGLIKIFDFYVEDKFGNRSSVLQSANDYFFILEFENSQPSQLFSNIVSSIGIIDNDNRYVLLFRTNFTNQNLKISQQNGIIECFVKDLNLTQGTYTINVFLSNGDSDIIDWVKNAAEITVEGGDYFGTGSIGLPNHCKVLTRTEWKIR